MSAAEQSGAPAAERVLPGSETYGRVVEFLYNEAELLDTYRFSEWLEGFTPEIDYRMPVRTTQFLTEGQGFHPTEFFVENRASLSTRVRRLETEFAWAETPPSRTRHFVSNVIVEHGAAPGELAVRSSFMITRTRADMDYQLFTGQRVDAFVELDGALRVAKRTILVDQTVITATNLSIFF